MELERKEAPAATDSDRKPAAAVGSSCSTLILHPLRPSAVRTAFERMVDLDVMTVEAVGEALGSKHPLYQALEKRKRRFGISRAIESPILQEDLLLLIASFVPDGATLANLAAVCKFTDSVLARAPTKKGDGSSKHGCAALWKGFLRRDFDLNTSDLTTSKQGAKGKKAAPVPPHAAVHLQQQQQPSEGAEDHTSASAPPLPPQCPSKALYGSLVLTRLELFRAEEARRMEESLNRMRMGVDKEVWNTLLQTSGIAEHVQPRGWSSYFPSWMQQSFWFGGGGGGGGAGGYR
jgi:hypothetical protein